MEENEQERCGEGDVCIHKMQREGDMIKMFVLPGEKQKAVKYAGCKKADTCVLHCHDKT